MLTELRARGLLSPLDVEFARSLLRIDSRPSPETALAIALASRSVRLGHTCFPLELRPSDLWPEEETSAWPSPSQWSDTLSKSALCDGGPLVLDDARRLYLRRYWTYERGLAAALCTPLPESSKLSSEQGWCHLHSTVFSRRLPAMKDGRPQRAHFNTVCRCCVARLEPAKPQRSHRYWPS